MKTPKSLSATYYFWLILLLLGAVGSLTIFWMYDNYNILKAEARYRESAYLRAQKEQIRYQVDQVIDYIEFKRSQANNRVRTENRNRVYEAYRIATHLYNRYHQKRSRKEMERLIIEALRAYRFNQDRGYFFIIDFSGMGKLNSDRPEIEGKSLLDIQDTRGRHVVREMIHIAQLAGEGHLHYTWTKPQTSGKFHKKIAFVKYFKPFEWVIGTGQYLDDIQGKIQQEVLERIGQIRYGRDGYLFVIDYDRIMRSHIQEKLIGNDMSRVVSVEGLHIADELIRSAQKPQGGFLTYTWHKPSLNRDVKKISFARGVNDWRWVVATGMYTDDLEKDIDIIHAGANRKIIYTLALITVLFCGLLACGFFITRYLANKIRQEFSRFQPLLLKGVTDNSLIDEKRLDFVEFRRLAASANEMVRKRKQAEVTSATTERRYRALFHEVREAILITSADGQVVDANQAAMDLFGYTYEELKGLHMDRIYDDPEDRQKLLESLNTAGAVTNYEVMMHGRNKVPITCRLSATVRRNTEGEVIGYQGIIRDVTETKKYEERMQQSQKLEAIGTLAGGIAHDFNNILFTISGNIELSLMQIEPGTQLEKNLRKVFQGVERASELIKQILTFSNQVPHDFQPERMDLIVREAVNLLRASIPSYIEITTDIETDGTVYADATQIQQVLMNLCTNSWLSMRKQRQGMISIRLRETRVTGTMEESTILNLPSGSYIDLEVRDTGKGIPESIQNRIFDPYFTTRPNNDGSGLGLAMVHGIITNHGGAITCESEEGKGTVFRILLPLLTDQTIAAGEDTPLNAPYGTERILYIDDDPNISQMIHSMLTEFGYQVTVSTDSREAWERIRENPEQYDVIVSDLTMPNITGDVLAEKIFSVRQDLPVIICTGYSDHALEKKPPIRQVIMKPVRIAKLGRAIRQVLNPAGS